MLSRHSPDAQCGRMQALSRLPLFFALEGRRVIVAGGSAAAAWKAELMSAAGAETHVFADQQSEEMLSIAAASPRGAVVIHRRCWSAQDFAGAALAVGDCEDECEAALFCAAARNAGVPVNVVDKPAFCDFAFGAIVNRSPLVIGISTDGAAPVFARAIRTRLEALIPQGFARWAAAARRWRCSVQTSGLSFAARRRFWQRFTDFAVSHPDREPYQADFDRFFGAARRAGTSGIGGSVMHVEAAEPDLLTLRDVHALQSADVIVFDHGVASEILDFARREAKKLSVNHDPHGRSCKEDEINGLMNSLAGAGKRVVRLKDAVASFAGDSEGLAACRRGDIAIEAISRCIQAPPATAQ